MGFRVSPGVSIKEIDLTTIIPAVATTPGGFAGNYNWGPANEIVTVSNEKELSTIFQKPDNNNYVDFFTPANFLQYGNSMNVVRVVGANATNGATIKAGASLGGVTAFRIDNSTDFAANEGLSASSQAALGILFAAKYPGVLGNSIKVVVTSGTGITGASLAVAASMGATFVDMTASTTSRRYFAVGDDISFDDGTVVTVSGVQKGVSTSATLTTLTPTYGDFFGVTSGYTGSGSIPHIRLLLSSLLPKAQIIGATIGIKSVYAKYVSTGATTSQYAADAGGVGDLVNVLVLDKAGAWTGTVNELLEKFEGLSRGYDARKFDGSTNYYRTVLNDESKYVWALSGDFNSNGYSAASSTGWTTLGSDLSTTSAVGAGVNSFGLTGAVSAAPSDSERWSNGWSKFADADQIDISLLPVGNASPTLSQLIIQQVCEKRLDCMAFVSPQQTDVENKLSYEALTALKTLRDTTFNVNSSYAVLDSGWKYQLDTYNNLVRIVPLNADIAGLVARTEFTNEAWFSPAGFNRGQIKSVVKLAYNPSSEAHRDELYTRQINPVVSFSGEGVILFGDKTMQTRPSAFDRINVRRLFIILEKAIATASKFFLFEQNDSFTRAQFKNLVVPFLKTVQQRRGITDFKVVCDDTNNTGEVIDRNEFVADIFVKPTRTVNFIQLNFVATKTGVNFSEVGG